MRHLVAASDRWINYYRLIGSVHIGEAVQPGDTHGAQNAVRDQRLMRYAGQLKPTIGIFDDPAKDSPTEP